MSLITGRIGFVWFLLTRPGTVQVLVDSTWCRCGDVPSAWPPLPLDTAQVAAVCRLLCVSFSHEYTFILASMVWLTSPQK